MSEEKKSHVQRIAEFSSIECSADTVVCVREFDDVQDTCAKLDRKQLVSFHQRAEPRSRFAHVYATAMHINNEMHAAIAAEQADPPKEVAVLLRMHVKDLVFGIWAADALEWLRTQIETHLCEPEQCICSDDKPNVAIQTTEWTDDMDMLYAAAQLFCQRYRMAQQMAEKGQDLRKDFMWNPFDL